MVFGKDEKEDWKEFLIPEAQQTLASLIESAKFHKGAYTRSEDVKVAQLWSALIEIKKELDAVKEMYGKVEGPFKAIVEMGDAEKKKTIQRLVTEMLKPTDEESQAATQKLVESLMKF